MNNRNSVIYWLATLFLCVKTLDGVLGLFFSIGDKNQNLTQLGYPPYLIYIIGLWSIIGIVVLLVPKFPLLKEWAYAGFFFVISGALASQILYQKPASTIVPLLALLIATVLSWYFRPMNKKLNLVVRQVR